MQIRTQAAVTLWVVMTGVTARADAQQTKAPPPRAVSNVVVETVAKGLVHPWGLQMLADGRMLVTERPGRLRVVARDGTVGAAVDGVPAVFSTGQGGLLDVAVAPDFATSGTIYLTYAEPRGAGTAATAVARAQLVAPAGAAAKLEAVAVIFRQQPATTGGLHFGARIAIAGDGNLFVTLGERFQRDKAQDLTVHYGKVIRITPEGKAPADNPNASTPGALPELWSMAIAIRNRRPFIRIRANSGQSSMARAVAMKSTFRWPAKITAGH